MFTNALREFAKINRATIIVVDNLEFAAQASDATRTTRLRIIDGQSHETRKP
jgi:hypothetical protein